MLWFANLCFVCTGDCLVVYLHCFALVVWADYFGTLCMFDEVFCGLFVVLCLSFC